jgi:hypothetical protein
LPGAPLRPAETLRLHSDVMAGLDPAIHHLRKRMDARVKPAHDDVVYFPALFGSATIMSSSMRAPGDDNWLMQIVVEAGSQSPK